MRAPSRRRHPAGFTLVEVLVGLLVGVIVLGAAALALRIGSQAVLGASSQTEAQQNARWALARMIAEIRGAGYDPSATAPAYHFDAVVGQGPTGLTIQSDFNGNALLDPMGGCDPTAVSERVGYRLAGTLLLRSIDPPGNGCESPIVGGVTSLAFGYLDADGNPAAVASAIRTVLVSVTMTSESGVVPRTVVMADRVRLRNR